MDNSRYFRLSWFVLLAAVAALLFQDHRLLLLQGTLARPGGILPWLDLLLPWLLVAGHGWLLARLGLTAPVGWGRRLGRWLGWHLSLVILPLALLAAITLQCLPLHDLWLTNLQRLALWADLALLLIFWPRVWRPDRRWRPWSPWWMAPGLGLASLLVILGGLLISHAGEWTRPLLPRVLDSPLQLLELYREQLFSLSLKQATLPAGGDLSRRDLRGLHFSSGTAPGVDFSRANLERAVFNGSHLEGARFAGARLAEASFEQTRLARADFRGADLTNGSFIGADLTGADFTDANLQGAILRWSARLEGARFDGARLEGAWLPLDGRGLGPLQKDEANETNRRKAGGRE
ncbi:MAG: pentapeptide repeat-containing protein [Magnetococcales bacterium]|nr:pentapeptide repeat-containing protein [Magnetococcales bacterium]